MKKQNNAMEFYRFLCAVLILCYHCQWYAFMETEETFGGYYVFVELFFILSGFLMMGSIRRRATEADRCAPADASLRYIKKRMGRFMPQHILSWVLVAAIRLFLLRDVYPIQVVQYGWSELLLVNVFGFVRDQYINIVVWYLSALVFASFLLYFLVLKDENSFVKVIAPILLIVCYGDLFDRMESLAATIHFYRYAPHTGFMRAIADLTVGILAYRAWEWMDDIKLPGEETISTVLEGFIFLASLVGLFHGGGRMDLLFVPLYFAFVISVFRGRSLWTRLFNNRLSAWLGGISYAYFLNNFVVIMPYVYAFPDSSLKAMAWFCVPVCLVVSVLTDGFLKLIMPRRGGAAT